MPRLTVNVGGVRQALQLTLRPPQVLAAHRCEGLKMFSKSQGVNVFRAVLLLWFCSVFVSFAAHFLSGRSFLDNFAGVMAITNGFTVVFLFLKKSIMSAILIVGGALMCFAVTVLIVNIVT